MGSGCCCHSTVRSAHCRACGSWSAGAGLLLGKPRTVKGTNKPVRPDSHPPARENTNSFATVLLDFGSEGIGPGMFTDARSIAVDGAGRIYVGEYTGGRIQVFDPAGKFLSQWTVGDRKTLLRGLAADRKGTVYLVHGGRHCVIEVKPERRLVNWIMRDRALMT